MTLQAMKNILRVTMKLGGGRLCCTIPAIGRAAIFEGFSYATGWVRGIPRAVKRLRTAIRT
jgi:hypothetical protein